MTAETDPWLALSKPTREATAAAMTHVPSNVMTVRASVITELWLAYRDAEWRDWERKSA